jgi:hypothetical protein
MIEAPSVTAQAKRFFRIEIHPIFEENDCYYRMVVCELQRNEDSSELFEIRDIMHFNTLEIAAEFLALHTKNDGPFSE